MNPTMPHAPSVEEALTTFSIRSTPAGDLNTDPVSHMPSRESVRARAQQAMLDADASGIKQKRLSLDMALGATWIDDSIGAVYTQLEAAGTLDDTLILFHLDHGMGGKNANIEPGVRIAMFGRYPNHAAGFFAAGTSHPHVVSRATHGALPHRAPCSRCHC